jgi:flavin-dependent dehydrogenase
MLETYDVVIVGAGPAGCMCAFSAKRSAPSLRILLIDKTSFPRTKSCGGVLKEEAYHFLTDTLKLSIPTNVYSSPITLDVLYLDWDTNFEFVQRKAFINIDRKLFDSWLLSLVENGVEIKECTKLCSFEVKKEYVHLTLSQGERKFQLKTRFLVDASGGKSQVRKCFGRNHIVRRVTIQEWVKPNQTIDKFCAIWDSQITDMVCWVIPKNDMAIIGAALIPDAEPLKKFSAFKEKLLSKISFSGIVVKKEMDLIYGPISRKGVCLGEEPILIAGEAAGIVSPLSGDGITSALMSGYFLGRAFSKPNVLKEYKQLATGKIINRLTKDIFIYNILSENKETRLRLFTALKAEERKEEEKRKGMTRLVLSKVGIPTIIRCSMKAWGLQ